MKKIMAIAGPMVLTAVAGWWAKRRKNQSDMQQEQFNSTQAHPARS